MNIMIQRFSDGTFIDWGRHVTVNGIRGVGGARYYSGEAAEVIRIILRYTEKKNDNTR